jgi:hypothetical protein
MVRHPIGPYLAYAFGAFCILSAPPFIGIPFPSRQASTYYTQKKQHLSELSGKRLTPDQAGYVSAALRILLGFGLISQRYRRLSCMVNGAIVSVGTVVAIRDGRPLMPQVGMLAAIAAVAILG